MKALALRISVFGIFALFVFAGIGCSSANTQGMSLGKSNPALLSSSAALVNNREEEPGIQLEDTDQDSLAMEPVYGETETSLNGENLLQIHCAKCHSVKLFEMTYRSRSYWEKTLLRMEGTRVSLSEEEKNVLLDYLVNPDKS